MSQPLQPLTEQLTQRLVNPFGLAIVTAIASSSFWFFGSLELALDGIFPATGTEAERVKKGVSDAAALKLWEWAFPRAKVSLLQLHNLTFRSADGNLPVVLIVILFFRNALLLPYC